MLVPSVAEAASNCLDIPRPESQVILSVLVAAIAVPVHRRPRPVLERRIFSERHALVQGIHELLEELGACGGPRDVLQCAGERIELLLRPESTAIYGRAGDAFVPVFVRGHPVSAGFDARGPLVATLETRVEPLTRRGWLRGEGVSDPSSEQHSRRPVRPF